MSARPAGVVLVTGALLVSAVAAFWLSQKAAPATQTHAPGPSATEAVSMVAVPRHNADDFQAGASVLIYGNDPAFAAKARVLLDHLTRLRVNSIAFVFPIFQDEITGSTVYAGPRTPTVANMQSLVRLAHQRGFTMMFRPLIDVQSSIPGHWRGVIKPRNPTTWFASYQELLLQYARLAQAERVEAFDVGSEMDSLEPATAFWRHLIGSMRGVFSGQLTYSSNWGNPFPGFEDALDFAGIDAYYPLAAPANATAEQLRRAWQKWVLEINRLQVSSGKPVVISELGTKSQAGSYSMPWEMDLVRPLDLQHQSTYYAGSCLALRGRFAGIYWWAFDLEPPAAPLLDHGFDPSGKPAELEIAKCFS